MSNGRGTAHTMTWMTNGGREEGVVGGEGGHVDGLIQNGYDCPYREIRCEMLCLKLGRRKRL